MTMKGKPKKTSSGLRQSLQIIRSVAPSRNGVSFNDLRRMNDLPSPTLSRLLKVLAEEEWVVKGEEGRYRCGPALVGVAIQATGGEGRSALLQPIVERLAFDAKESAAFVEWDEGGITFRAKREMPESYHYISIGSTNKILFDHGFSLLAMAYAKADIIEKCMDKNDFSRFADNRKKCLAKLDKIRRQGWIVYHDKGIRIGAPVFVGDSENLAGVIGVSLMPRKLGKEESDRLLRLVQDAAQKAATAIS